MAHSACCNLNASSSSCSASLPAFNPATLSLSFSPSRDLNLCFIAFTSSEFLSDRESGNIEVLSNVVPSSVRTVPHIALPTFSAGPKYFPSLLFLMDGSLVSSNPFTFEPLVSTNQTQSYQPNSAMCEMSTVSPVILVAGTAPSN